MNLWYSKRNKKIIFTDYSKTAKLNCGYLGDTRLKRCIEYPTKKQMTNLGWVLISNNALNTWGKDDD